VLHYYELVGHNKWDYLCKAIASFGVWFVLAWLGLVFVKMHKR